MKTSLLTCLASTLVFAALSGCASYKLGLPKPDEYSGVFVKPVLNDSAFAEIESIATLAISKHIDERAGLRAVSLPIADAILETRILDLDREIAAVETDDVGRGRKFELTFLIQISLFSVRSPNNDPILSRTIEVRQDILAGDSQVNAERQAGPEIARKIGRRIAETIGDTW